MDDKTNFIIDIIEEHNRSGRALAGEFYTRFPRAQRLPASGTPGDNHRLWHC